LLDGGLGLTVRRVLVLVGIDPFRVFGLASAPDVALVRVAGVDPCGALGGRAGTVPGETGAWAARRRGGIQGRQDDGVIVGPGWTHGVKARAAGGKMRRDSVAAPSRARQNQQRFWPGMAESVSLAGEGACSHGEG
jgi:hypothetical protein